MVTALTLVISSSFSQVKKSDAASVAQRIDRQAMISPDVLMAHR